jgi:hypothetical protein
MWVDIKDISTNETVLSNSSAGAGILNRQRSLRRFIV